MSLAAPTADGQERGRDARRRIDEAFAAHPGVFDSNDALRPGIGRLRRAVEDYFAFQADGEDSLKDVLAAFPWTRRNCGKINFERDQLRREIDRLYQDAQADRLRDPLGFFILRRRFKLFCDRLKSHLYREENLVMESFFVDIGPAD